MNNEIRLNPPVEPLTVAFGTHAERRMIQPPSFTVRALCAVFLSMPIVVAIVLSAIAADIQVPSTLFNLVAPLVNSSPVTAPNE